MKAIPFPPVRSAFAGSRRLSAALLLLAAAVPACPIRAAEPTAPQAAPTDLPAGAKPAEPIGQWTVARIRIPHKSDIQEAYVELKTPLGPPLTLTRGETSSEGLRIEKLQWSGSPVRAIITLRQGPEKRELLVDPAKIEQDDTLERKALPVQLTVKFLELEPEVAKSLTLSGGGAKPLPLDRFLDGTSPRVMSTAVLNDEQVARIDAALNGRTDQPILQATQESRPGVKSEPIRLLHDLPAEADSASSTTGQSRRQGGMIVRIDASADQEGMIDLTFERHIAEYEITTPGTLPAADPAPAPKPVFSTRAISTSISIHDGSSVVVSAFDTSLVPLKSLPLTPGRIPLLIITARIPLLDEQPH